MNLEMETTHKAFSFILIIAQCFATFPVSGILNNNVQRLKLNFRDVRVYYCFFYLISLLINMGFYVLKIAKEVKFGYFVTLLFYSCSFVTTIIFLVIAKNWNKLMQFWTRIDVKMEYRRYGFPKKLKKKIWLITIFVLFGAVCKLFYASSNIPSNGLEAVNEFLRTINQHIFYYIPYGFLLGLFFELISVFSTFTWNYMDLFIMVISISLSERFQQVSTRILQIIQSNISDINTWKEIREDYNNLSVLCKKIDFFIGDLILLSFANNVFVILVQLLNTLEPKSNNDIIGRLYFICSFGFLIIRTILVCMFASKVYDESQRSFGKLNSLPNHFYNVEIDRLLIQINVDPCCLTGRRLFNVKKSLILSIAGAIVTYELILIQFHVN
nr:gustatory receptor for sugar taste 64f-like [Onthophagus taurus]